MKTNTLRSILLLVCSLLCGHAFAQKEATNWYFGNKAGIKFGPTPSALPTVLTDSKMTAIEGCSSISDSLGNLLFYTAGDTVYNFQHKKMNNGYLLSGHQSATQSSLIIPQPGSNRLYYLFTVDALGGPAGLKYSVIDIKAQNGQGNVLAKNIPLVSPVAEKITAVDHRSSKDIWVITHGFGTQSGGNFYAYRVSANGIANPIISAVGTQHGPLPQDAVGALKASPDGSKLALAMENSHLAELFDFNDETGIVSKPITFQNLGWTYGVEFTPDGSRLFVSTVQSNAFVISYNLLAAKNDPDSIRHTQTTIGSSTAMEGGSLQLAPNYLIYMAMPQTYYLSRVGTPNNPVFKTLFQNNSLPLDVATVKSRQSRQGLPAFNQSYFYRPEFKTNIVCIGDKTIFNIIGRKQFKSVRWSFSDPSSGADSISTTLSPTHIFTKSGRFNVKLKVLLLNGKTYSNTIPIDVVPLPNFSLGPDLEICPNGSVKLKGPKSLKSYLWSNGKTSDSIFADKPGRYILKIVNSTGCTYQDTIEVKLKPGPALFDQKYYETCLRDTITIRTIFTGKGWHWDNNSTAPERRVSKAGWYKGYGTYNGCTFTDSVEVAYKECLGNLMIPNIITPNGDDRNETFTLLGLKPGDWHIQIFNRWGVMIFEDQNYRNDWPRDMPAAGTYYYLLRKNGSSQSYKGWLEVMH